MPFSLPYNTAVREQRRSSPSALDFLPTQPWAVRALVDQILGADALAGSVVCEPAAGAGDIARTLLEFTPHVRVADVADYGIRNIYEQPISIRDFLSWTPAETEVPDWICTNPPFTLGEGFIHHALRFARRGVAVIVRTAFLEGQGRYERLFSRCPPDVIAVHAERVPMFSGRLEAKKGSATSYSWLIWFRNGSGEARTRWIAPCREIHERASDYHGWRWCAHGGQPLPHLSIVGSTDVEHDVSQALAILRDPVRAVIHPGRLRVVSSLIETTPDCRERVLARISVWHADTDPKDAQAKLEQVLVDHGLRIDPVGVNTMLAA
ncbi:hypothetical protein [Azospirillum argentinense]|uniref:Methyltransferase n=1 Tax=Azospirillum argentinense TaxID=2970906 RepID=A0A5B0KNC4_9PROT|nr:hypothetical protein [Azospirillum argentinense]KAA1053769.1 hypothetical protein FH063_002351 [Azospirillum argentinense]